MVLKFRMLNEDFIGLSDAVYFGGSGDEEANAIAINPDTGEIFVTGFTDSDDLADPRSTNGVALGRGGGTDAFITRFDGELEAILRTTYLGGSGIDEVLGPGLALAAGDRTYVYAAGLTDSSDFPGTLNTVFQPSFGGTTDGFVGRIGYDLSPTTPGPDIDVEPRDHNFGETAIHGSSPVLSIIISNLGTEVMFERISLSFTGREMLGSRNLLSLILTPVWEAVM
jgi:hypothetical protein